jgi:flagellar motor protein MotB
LGSLADAINGYPDLKVIVVGNTDDQKFKKGDKDNLS